MSTDMGVDLGPVVLRKPDKPREDLEAGTSVLVRGVVTAVHPDGSINVRFPVPSGEYCPEYSLHGSVVEVDPDGLDGFVPAGLDPEHPRATREDLEEATHGCPNDNRP